MTRRLMNMQQLVECELAGKTKVLGENLPPCDSLSTTKPTLFWGLNLGHRGGKLFIMNFITSLALMAVAYAILYVIALLFVDCDLRLAWAEKFGKPIDCLAGKVVWITGASSGIGEHISLALARAGVKIVLSARRTNELERVRQSCLKVGKNLKEKDILVLPMDVVEVEKHKAYFQQVIDHFGQLDVLVNNAGRSQRAIWEEIELAVDKEMFNLNVFSVLSLSRIAVQHFMKQNEGHIVVTSSLAGVMAAPYSASYIGAKHAIHGYFDALRLEKVKHNITVTLLCPGPVFSNILADSFTGRPEEKFGKPMEITDRRMTTERCGHLCAVAIANKLDEAWMALPPIIFMVHFLICYPNVASLVTRFLGPKFFLKMRDTKVRMDIKSD